MPFKIKIIQELDTDDLSVDKFENKISEYLKEGLGSYEIHYSTCTKDKSIMYSALIVTTIENPPSQMSFTTTDGTAQFTSFDGPTITTTQV